LLLERFAAEPLCESSYNTMAMLLTASSLAVPVAASTGKGLKVCARGCSVSSSPPHHHPSVNQKKNGRLSSLLSPTTPPPVQFESSLLKARRDLAQPPHPTPSASTLYLSRDAIAHSAPRNPPRPPPQPPSHTTPTIIFNTRRFRRGVPGQEHSWVAAPGLAGASGVGAAAAGA
jgi:hypothetical protein